MKITNNMGLPTPFLQAVELDRTYTEDRRKKQLEMERQPHVTLDETVIDAAEVTQNTPRRKIVRKDD